MGQRQGQRQVLTLALAMVQRMLVQTTAVEPGMRMQL